MLVELSHVDLAFGGPSLLEDADLAIDRGARIALIGRNGSGKSSLMKLLADEIAPDDGERRAMEGIRIGYLPQEGDMAPFGGSALEAALTAGGAGEIATGKMLDRLGVDHSAPFAALSGGLKRRTALARALAGRPDLLLLDEPTNHLDPDTIEWLEKWLAAPGLAVVFISHDRRFVANVASEILELDRGRLYHGRTGYERYLVEREARLAAEGAERARFEKKLDEEETWIRTGIKARRTRNEGRVRRLEEMRRRAREYRKPESTTRAGITTAATSGRMVLELDHAGFAYGPTRVLDDVNLRVMRGEKIGIIGANGSGKTTLVKLMLGHLEPTTGSVRRGTRLEIAEFDQHRATLDDDATIVDNVGEGREFMATGRGERHIIGYLGDFLFTPDQARAPVRRLSGGERARVMLARLFSRPFNLLVMDEPTNDLDVETLELLEELLTDYDGTAVLVSHDRAFLDNVVTSIVHLDGSGSAVEYVGGYAEYQRVREASVPSPRAAASAKPRPSRPRTRLGYKQQRELDALPADIEKLESTITSIHERMAAPGYYAGDPAAIGDDARLLEETEAALKRLYARWEELEGLTEGSG